MSSIVVISYETQKELDIAKEELKDSIAKLSEHTEDFILVDAVVIPSEAFFTKVEQKIIENADRAIEQVHEDAKRRREGETPSDAS